MAYGSLKVICGPMFGGKTTTLLRDILWARNGEEKDTLVVKPAFDNRYAETRIVTHDGLSVNCHSIKEWSTVERKADFAEIVFFDEVQFFEEPNFDGDIIDIIKNLLRDGKSVVCNGLDMDVFGNPFSITASLLGMADEAMKLTSVCSVCGRTATKTFRTTDGAKKVELGSTDIYEPRCNTHWVPAE